MDRIEDPKKASTKIGNLLSNFLTPEMKRKYLAAVAAPGVSGPGQEDYNKLADQQAMNSLISGVQAGASRVGGIEVGPSALPKTLGGMESSYATQLKAGEQAAAQSAASKQAATEGLFKLGEYETGMEDRSRKTEREDYTFDLTKQENDPASTASQMAREIVSKVVPVPGGATYAQLKSMIPTSTQAKINAQAQEENRTFQAGQQSQRIASQGKLAGMRESAADRRSTAAIEAAGIKKAQQDSQKSFANTSALRKEYNANKVTKDTTEMNRAYGNITSATTSNPADPNARKANDLALVFSFMKMLDPGSVVRESEFRSAASIGGLPGEIEVMRNKILGDGMLPESARQAMLSSAETLYRNQQGRQRTLDQTYSMIAQRNNFNVDDIGLLGSAAPADTDTGGPDSGITDNWEDLT